MARLWRAWVAPLPRRAGEEVVLPPDEAHHVRRVLRLREGEPLALFDGTGHEVRATLVRCAADEVRARVEEPLGGEVEPALALRVFQGLCRPDRMEWLVQKLTEVGVASIHPLATQRAEVPPLGEARLRRLRRIAVEACKQSGRRRLPEIDPRDALPRARRGTPALLLDGGAPLPLAAVLPDHAPPEAWLAVGPESGFAEAEVEQATTDGWSRASLGPRTLRTEGAGLVAAAILLHRWADLGS